MGISVRNRNRKMNIYRRYTITFNLILESAKSQIRFNQFLALISVFLIYIENVRCMKILARLFPNKGKTTLVCFIVNNCCKICTSVKKLSIFLNMYYTNHYQI